jgi:hypothetical protein
MRLKAEWPTDARPMIASAMFRILSTLTLAAALAADPQAQVGAVARGVVGARVNVNAYPSGEHSYSIHNTTGQTIYATVTVTLWDSEGGRTEKTETIAVGPGSVSRGRLTTTYAKAYGRPGGVHLFAQTVVSGGASSSYTAQSSFYVGP